jgi:hypothetical protein
MRRNLTSDGEDGAVGPAAVPSQVIPFRRATAAHVGSAAGDDPSSPPAIPLGTAVQAVVLKLANKRIRLRVESPSREEEDRGSR